MSTHVGYIDPMAPETERLIEATVEALAAKTIADETLSATISGYRMALRAALATGERGVLIELSRRLGRSREALRLDADDAARAARLERRKKGR